MKRKNRKLFIYFRIAMLLLMAFALLRLAAPKHVAEDATPAETDTTQLIPAKLSDRPEQLLQREGYTLSYNKQWRQANWVYWRLTAERTVGTFNEKNFQEDFEVPTPRPTKWDYYNSGFDRGHMCPAADNKYSEQARSDSYLYTNMSPQNHQLNAGDWNTLEMKCRDWARRYGEIHIVCGPLFTSQHPKTIGRSRVAVPDAYFKAVFIMQGSGGKPDGIAFVMPNKAGHQPLKNYAISIDSLERLTAIDFFASLDDAVEDKVEAQQTARFLTDSRR